MVITAFFSAMMGGLLAPLVVNVAARMGDFELPVLPDIGDLEVPEFPIKRVNQKKKKTKKGRELMEDSIVELISRGLKHLNSNQAAAGQHKANNHQDGQHQDDHQAGQHKDDHQAGQHKDDHQAE